LAPQVVQLLVLALAAIAAGVAVVAAWRSGRGAGRQSEDLRPLFAELRAELDQKASAQRMELNAALVRLTDSLGQRVDQLAGNLNTHFQAFAEVQQKSFELLSDGQHKRLSETNQTVLKLVETLNKQQTEGQARLSDELDKVRKTLGENLDKLRQENEAKLEQMRQTVDEKLQGTLNERLGENFKRVGDQLEAVHKGLGEMQALASGVGDLKRVLTNVKSRGGWGEVQLGRVIEDAFTPEQYEKNFRPEPKSAEQVEFAVRMPGQGDPCFIPIDSKFPNEAYERLLAAQDRADPAEVEKEAMALERVVRAEAQRICKYLNPPRTTDFAVMFLPTEGLYAEVIRRPGLFDDLQRKFRVTVVGPTTLGAFLTALQMGFRTLAIEKRSSEVWQVLAAAKLAFHKYGEALDAVDKKLDEAKRKVADVGVRNRDVTRRLKNVETYDLQPAALAAPVLQLVDGGQEDSDDEEVA